MFIHIRYINVFRSHENEQRVLSDQLEDVKGRLKAAEEQNSRAPAALLKVQRELGRTQVSFCYCYGGVITRL